jgi:hypothetical protein
VKSRRKPGEKSEEAILLMTIETTELDEREGPLLQPAKRGSKCRCMPEGQPHHKIKHENSSASYTWRPRGAGTDGSMRYMTASSGLIFCGGHGEKYAETVGAPEWMA